MMDNPQAFDMLAQMVFQRLGLDEIFETLYQLCVSEERERKNIQEQLRQLRKDTDSDIDEMKFKWNYKDLWRTYWIYESKIIRQLRCTNTCLTMSERKQMAKFRSRFYIAVYSRAALYSNVCEHGLKNTYIFNFLGNYHNSVKRHFGDNTQIASYIAKPVVVVQHAQDVHRKRYPINTSIINNSARQMLMAPTVLKEEEQKDFDRLDKVLDTFKAYIPRSQEMFGHKCPHTKNRIYECKGDHKVITYKNYNLRRILEDNIERRCRFSISRQHQNVALQTSFQQLSEHGYNNMFYNSNSGKYEDRRQDIYDIQNDKLHITDIKIAKKYGPK